MKRILKSVESRMSRREEPRDRVVSHAPEKNIPTSNNVERNHSPTVPTLVPLGEWIDVIESTGFDPYNSGSFETSKSRSRK